MALERGAHQTMRCQTISTPLTLSLLVKAWQKIILFMFLFWSRWNPFHISYVFLLYEKDSSYRWSHIQTFILVLAGFIRVYQGRYKEFFSICEHNFGFLHTEQSNILRRINNGQWSKFQDQNMQINMLFIFDHVMHFL